ncbi:MAG: RNA polymerase sigma factor [Armatimonadota bacterium]
MLAFQRGDESAFAALFERNRTRVLNTAYHFLGDKDAAQDVAQEVFVKIYTSPKTYRPDAALSTWLYRITANACLDHLRKQKRHKAMSEEISESVLDPSASPQSRVESEDLVREVRSALATLPENQRMAVVLQRYEGLSYQQVADVLKISVSAVESLLFRAKNSLRAKLSAYVEGSEERGGLFKE